MQNNDLQPSTERYIVIIAFLVFVVGQIHAILHHGYHGQDFERNKGYVVQAAQQPFLYIHNAFNSGYTNPPLYALLGGIIYNLSGGVYCLEGIALLQLALNVIGFYLLYRIMVTLIASPVLRLACIIFLIFIPFVRITAIVLATDGLVMPLFFIITYYLVRLCHFMPFKRYIAINAILFF